MIVIKIKEMFFTAVRVEWLLLGEQDNRVITT